MYENIRERIAKQFEEARKRTLQIFDLAAESDLRQSPGFGFRPILWHLAHTGAFEEFWLLGKIAGENPINERFQIVFDPIKTPRENSKNLPSKAEMLDFLQKVRTGVLRVLETANFDSKNPLLRDAYIFDLVLQHELQHQETLAYLFHLLPPEKLQTSNFKVQSFVQKTANDEQRTILYESSEAQIGCAGRNGFCYDNEIPANRRFVPAFRLDKFLTTNREYSEFIRENGYERSEFWSAEGWRFREKENWQHPLYWRKNGGDWQIRRFAQENSLSELKNHPVYGVSFYEAEAYANFRRKRLPTEFEWERAATHHNESKTLFAFGDDKPTPENCNFGFNFWNTTPVNCFQQAGGAFDLSGNLWEWTSSGFEPYENFEPFPYSEYSQEWFDGDHKVLKGGSFATSEEILRASFRNFFRRPFRIAFAGIRLAEDA